jgi:hypothetical protein
MHSPTVSVADPWPETHFWRSNRKVQARTIAVRRSESCRTYASGSLLRVEGPVKKKRKKKEDGAGWKREKKNKKKKKKKSKKCC